MPSIIQPPVYETCFPCKWHQQHLWRSGLRPIYHSVCNHPSELHGNEYLTFKGKLIGENTDRRPDWCPLRNDPAAERTAMEDDEDDET